MDQGLDLNARPARRLRAAGAAFALALTLTPPPVAGAPSIRLDAAAGSVEVTGLDGEALARLDPGELTEEDRRAIFSVTTGPQPAGAGQPPVAGAWSVDGGVLRFTPRFPFVPGLDYTARFDLDRLLRRAGVDPSGTAPIEATLSLPRPERERSTVVTRVYPTASELPENLLKLYLCFSAPMSRGEAYDRVRLLDADGRPVDGAFLEIGEELWDHEQRRLTLFFDPGRIKRGLRPHLEAGPPLTERRSYRLEIDPAWRDADGLSLAEGHEKRFTVTAADRESPDPETWRLAAPAAGGREALELSFPEPLDHALLLRSLHVEGPDGQLAGRVEVGDAERLWRFKPEAPWRVGDHAIEIETILEDLAGNNLNAVFDVDAAAGPTAATRGGTVSLPFRVGRP